MYTIYKVLNLFRSLEAHCAWPKHNVMIYLLRRVKSGISGDAAFCTQKRFPTNCLRYDISCYS
jgi:hypothetical protein